MNYIRGLYGFLFAKNDEELAVFDIDSLSDQALLFEEMSRSFSGFGPIARENIVDGIEFISTYCDRVELWRSAVPHDLALDGVNDRRGYLECILFALTGKSLSSVDSEDFVLIDEIGPAGLDYSK